MKLSRELTIYYIETKCPSKVVGTITYSYEPAFKWAARHLKDDFFIWGYFIFHRPQDSNILHISTIKGSFKTGTDKDVFMKIDLSDWEEVNVKKFEKFTYRKYLRKEK